jgi:hypothetical protein
VRKIGLRPGSRNTCGNLKKGESRLPKKAIAWPKDFKIPTFYRTRQVYKSKSSGADKDLYEKVRSRGRGIDNPIAIAVHLELLAEKQLKTVFGTAKRALTFCCC